MLREAGLNVKKPLLASPRSPRLRNPDQLRRGERYPQCTMSRVVAGGGLTGGKSAAPFAALAFNPWSEVGPIRGSRNVVSEVDCGRCPLLLEQILHLNPVAGPDFVSDFVEQFEHGESLLGCPSGWDFDVDRTQMRGQRRRRGRRRAHGLAVCR